MNAKSKLVFSSIAALACVGMADHARADSITGTINIQWVFAPPILSPLSLPAVQSIDSIEIELAHVNGHDFALYVDLSAVKGELDFNLMFKDTAEPPPGDDFSMGLEPEDGTLENVATYTFVPSGGGGLTAPHTPPGTLNANAWLDGPLPAQKYILNVGDLEVLFDGGAVGTWTINYTPVPAVPGDINGDGVVNVDDLLAVITNWGPCAPPPDPCPADVNSDGAVNVDDLLLVIVNWG